MAANAGYHDRLTSKTTEERVSRLQQMSVHLRDGRLACQTTEERNASTA